MENWLADWPRKFFSPGAKDASLFYVIYGHVDATQALSRKEYRSSGLPEGLDVSAYGPNVHPEVVTSFLEGYLWDQLVANDPPLADEVALQDSCLILRGEVKDPPTLNYFRDVIGLLTFFLDHGGVAIYDPQMFRWWSPSDWRSCAFESENAHPRHHVTILLSAESGGTQWIHTRGMRKFGRPDLSIHRVPSDLVEPAVDLCNRFIETLAFGEQVRDGQAINLKSLPGGMRCFCRGDKDDPDFNNEHIEIVWPGEAPPGW